MKTGLLLLFLLFGTALCAQSDQYILNGSARQDNCNCYTLTGNTMNQSGSVWNKNKISLTQPFDFSFNINVGCQDANGADGMVFILQPVSTSIGSTGEGMGFSGVSPSIGIALDTWQNLNQNDPEYDHISLQANGNVNHAADLDGPRPISVLSSNFEDCKWHVLRITWDPSTKWLTAFIDGIIRIEKQVDLIGSIFNNDPLVYWGFTAATGGATNVQQFCTALNPAFSFGLPDGGTCTEDPVTLSDESVSFAPVAYYHWDFGDGTISNQKSPPPHAYAAPGKYTVKLAIRGLDGCESDTLKRIITIGSVPAAQFDIDDTCYSKPPPLAFTPTGTAISYSWKVNGQTVPGNPLPDLSGLDPGAHQLELIASSNFGCGPDAVASRGFTILPTPQTEISADDGCVGEPVSFTGKQTNAAPGVQQWQWTFGDGSRSTVQHPQHVFSRTGDYTVQLSALGTNGCRSQTAEALVRINKAQAEAGSDTVVFPNSPFVLQGAGNGSFLWTPAAGLDNDRAQRPTGQLTDDQRYRLQVTTPEGCTATDSVLVEVFKGSSIYVPTGFTPNGDYRNDLLLPKYVGIKKLHFFTVFNRWGQTVFTTGNMQAGWNGRIGGNPAATGTYVWMLKAEDLAGKVYQLKGTVTLVK